MPLSRNVSLNFCLFFFSSSSILFLYFFNSPPPKIQWFNMKEARWYVDTLIRLNWMWKAKSWLYNSHLYNNIVCKRHVFIWCFIHWKVPVTICGRMWKKRFPTHLTIQLGSIVLLQSFVARIYLEETFSFWEYFFLCEKFDDLCFELSLMTRKISSPWILDVKRVTAIAFTLGRWKLRVNR